MYPADVLAKWLDIDVISNICNTGATRFMLLGLWTFFQNCRWKSSIWWQTIFSKQINGNDQPWWMMPFSRRAWPRWTPSSGFPVSPISISQDTNSLRTNENMHTHLGLETTWQTNAGFHRGDTPIWVSATLNCLGIQDILKVSSIFS